MVFTERINKEITKLIQEYIDKNLPKLNSNNTKWLTDTDNLEDLNSYSWNAICGSVQYIITCNYKTKQVIHNTSKRV